MTDCKCRDKEKGSEDLKKNRCCTNSGRTLLADEVRTKGTAYSEAERRALGIEGLLPPVPASLACQAEAMLETYRSLTTPMEKSLFLDSLRAANETLFFKLLMDNVDELLPVAYTPTVGDFCKRFSHIFRFPRGMFLSIEDRGRLREILDNAQDEVDMIVVTDGERILGLGDLGVNGHGIPVGKLVFYTVCAGVDPARCLGITLDVGTNRERYLTDPLYLGHRHGRVRGTDYDSFIEEFFEAVKDKWPNCAIQFEDFANQNAFRLLEKYQNRYACFSDDIQGTAAAVVAGFFAVARAKKGRVSDERILFLGAGESGTGAAQRGALAHLPLRHQRRHLDPPHGPPCQPPALCKGHRSVALLRGGGRSRAADRDRGALDLRGRVHRVDSAQDGCNERAAGGLRALQPELSLGVQRS